MLSTSADFCGSVIGRAPEKIVRNNFLRQPRRGEAQGCAEQMQNPPRGRVFGIQGKGIRWRCRDSGR